MHSQSQDFRKEAFGLLAYQQIPAQPLQSASFWKRANLPSFLGWLPFVVFYAVLANIPFWVASRWLGIFQNGWLCLEYVAIGLAALFVPRILGAALLLSMIAIDLIAGVCQTYFLSVVQCFTNFNAVGQFSRSRLLAGVAVVFLALLATAIAAALPIVAIKRQYRVRAALCLITFAVIVSAFDAATVLRRPGGLSRFLHSRTDQPDEISSNFFTEFRLSRVPLFRLAKIEIGYAKIRTHIRVYRVTPASIPSAAAQAIHSSGLDPKMNRQNLSTANLSNQDLPNVVVVVVESWGLDGEAAVNDGLLQPYTQPGLLARYQVLRGSVPHFGTTVTGEARELCGTTIGFHLLEASPAEMQDCLPAQLATLGYKNIAVHGMDGHLFNRTAWYRTIGFKEILFRDQLEQKGLPDCKGAFTGTCDASVAEWIGKRLDGKDPNPDFVYWMTLNSHLPVLVPSPLKTGASCNISTSLTQQPALCSWFQLVANVHRSVAALAMSTLGRTTVFAIVGDHAPPFSDPTLRSRFSPKVVPYILLVPRSSVDHHAPLNKSDLNKTDLSKIDQTARASLNKPPPTPQSTHALALSGEHLAR
jgi:hypothetical protein